MSPSPWSLPVTHSHMGSSSVLSHQLPNGHEVSFAYYSYTLFSTERNYTQIDKEALAIIAGIKKFQNYLYSHQFTIITDHKPLLGHFGPNCQMPQVLSLHILCWFIFLSAYQYSLHFFLGKAICHADAPSHLPVSASMTGPAPVHCIMLLESFPDPPLHV